MENFQRMNYIQMHDYLNHQYNEPAISEGSYDPRSYNETNQPYLIGYIYSENFEENSVYPLYQIYDYSRGKWSYAYKDSKDNNNQEPIYVLINPKTYNDVSLSTGDTVKILPNNASYLVKLYDIKTTGLETRYHNKNYQDEMETYGLLRPIDDNILLDQDNKYFVLYRQTIDPRRDVYNYYIKDNKGLIIELPKTKSLENNDKILIPGKEKYGEYKLTVSNIY
jgi:hypothetical protein